MHVSLKTGYHDWGGSLRNVLTAKNGKITFIDTEDKSFSPKPKNCCTSFCVWNLVIKLLYSIKRKVNFNILWYKFENEVKKCKKYYKKNKVSNNTADIRWSSEKFNYYKQYDLKYIRKALKQYQNKERALPTAY
jgi:hypothetical protein